MVFVHVLPKTHAESKRTSTRTFITPVTHHPLPYGKHHLHLVSSSNISGSAREAAAKASLAVVSVC